jgi:hypothetical protein
MLSYRSSLRFVPVQWFLQSYGLWTLKFGQIFSCHHFFFAMLGDIDLIFGIWVYNDELQIKFTFRSGPLILGRVMALGLWNSGQIFSCHHFISLWFEILTWFLVWDYIIISYRSTLKSIPVEWFLANLQPLAKYLVDFWYVSV